MKIDSDQLRRDLRTAGLSEQAIDAAWPRWWSDKADGSVSAQAELRFEIARKLGVSPVALSDDRVEFVWDDAARFKHLSPEIGAQKAALASFGVAVGRILLQGTSGFGRTTPPDALDLRASILSAAPFVSLTSLLATCWSIGIPVMHLRVFPLAAKRMHAMVVGLQGRYAILLGRDAQYPAPIAFTLAHELGHVALGHLRDSPAIVDLDDPASAIDSDQEEDAADKYALSLLTGRPEPIVETNVGRFGARQLAAAVKEAGPKNRIEPGTLALCYAYRTANWPKAVASLQYIYTQKKPAWHDINKIAASQIDWPSIPEDLADFLKIVMGLEDE